MIFLLKIPTLPGIKPEIPRARQWLWHCATAMYIIIIIIIIIIEFARIQFDEQGVVAGASPDEVWQGFQLIHYSQMSDVSARFPPPHVQ